jgi:hypothetical protein
MLEKNTVLVEKWEPILEGIGDDYVRHTTAVLLENQARAILTEAASNGQTLEEATTVGNLGTFQKFAFPLVRRVFPELIANKICGVQPMQGPVSQVFYLGNSRAGVGADGNARSEVVYSRHQIVYANRVGAAQDNIHSLDVSTPSYNAAAGNHNLSGSMTEGGGITTDASATVGGQIAAFPKENLVGPQYFVSAGERLSGSGIPEINFHIEQQAVTARTRKFRALWTLEAAQDLRAYHNLDLERELTDLLGKEVALEIDRELIEDIRGIAYDWEHNHGGWFRQKEAEANSFQGDAYGDAGAQGSWKYDQPHGRTTTGGVVGGSNAGTQTSTDMPVQTHRSNVFFVDFGSSALGLYPRHVGEVYSNLIAVINFASQDIYKTTLRGGATWMICSPFIAAMLSSAAKLEGGLPANSDGQLGASVQYKGKWMGMYDVYVDPLYPDDEILMGYKGNSPMDSGFAYCPYVPLQMLPTITDPETFQPRKGLLTRYGKAEISPASRFYRIIRIVGADANYLLKPFAQAIRS